MTDCIRTRYNTREGQTVPHPSSYKALQEVISVLLMLTSRDCVDGSFDTMELKYPDKWWILVHWTGSVSQKTPPSYERDLKWKLLHTVPVHSIYSVNSCCLIFFLHETLNAHRPILTCFFLPCKGIFKVLYQTCFIKKRQIHYVIMKLKTDIAFQFYFRSYSLMTAGGSRDVQYLNHDCDSTFSSHARTRTRTHIVLPLTV